MSSVLSVARPRMAPPAPTSRTDPWQWQPRTKSGSVKRRTSRKEKVRLLCPVRPPIETWAWLKRFANLFAFWRSQAIIRREGGTWLTLRVPLSLDQIVRHLLGNRLPGQAATWVGTRSRVTTRFACIDVDADPPLNNMLDDQIEHATSEIARQRAIQRRERERKRRARTTPFPERCQRVEDALRLLGIDPTDPNQVLVQLTPSGGRHYYFFLDASYQPDQAVALLEQAGLRNCDGQIEFYPRASRGLRLPFGWVPGKPFDPMAWLKFIKTYWFGQIKRFSLLELLDHLVKHQTPHLPTPSMLSRAASSVRPPTAPSPGPGPQETRRRRHPHQHHHQQNQQQQQRPNPTMRARVADANLDRYRQLVEDGPKSGKEAEELLAGGIRAPGTRTRVLLRLAIHLIWCRHAPEQEARETLTTWASDRRHQSKDIQDDLASGTTTVADHIRRICTWVAKHQQTTASGAVKHRTGPAYAAEELAELRPHIQWLPKQEQLPQAHFLLRFLAFAKQHGRPGPDGYGWEAAPAITAIVKRWPGCRHGNDYKKHFDHATAAKLLTMTKEKWQNPNGPGRARTYRIATPVVPPQAQVIDYDAALAFLTDAAAVGAQEERAPTNRLRSNPAPAEPRHQPGEAANERNRDQPAGISTTGRANPAAVRPADPGTALAPAPRERPPQPGAPPDVRREAPGSSHRRRRTRPNRNARRPREDIVAMITEEHRQARERRRTVQRQQLWPKTQDGCPLPPPHDEIGIAMLLAATKDEVDVAFPGQNASKHPTWKTVEAIARSPDYTTEERSLILSNPANLPEGQLKAWQALIRQHRQQIADSSGLSVVTGSPRDEGVQMQIPKRKTERWMRRLGGNARPGRNEVARNEHDQ